ncbi:hypothetical protein K445DRAFT_18614 [Daldinia sp. EC12]|nr:hypothetical protein F4774DRAFT_407472 [Daldinia eschscholtzii]OTB20075.1 hypothetical protein K445DRAFT_18614 [Daldinia sp. EC12]
MAGEQNLEDHGKHRVVPPKPPPRPPTPDPPYKQDPPLYATHLWKCCKCKNSYAPQEIMCTKNGCRHGRCKKCTWEKIPSIPCP